MGAFFTGSGEPWPVPLGSRGAAAVHVRGRRRRPGVRIRRRGGGALRLVQGQANTAFEPRAGREE
jgi:hypothetical protein